MSEFDAAREALAGHRRELEGLREEALLAREELRRRQRALAELERAGGREREAERRRLEAAVEEARGASAEAQARLGELRQAGARVAAGFADFSDPRRGLRRWPDRFPILLLPLRLETRFKAGEDGRPQLWVRVYPDSCLVDGFEPALTEQEVENARVFWAAVWRAGGDEALERAAWRELVASHGAGRAGWIVREYAPADPDAAPTRDDPSDVLLVVVADEDLPPAAGDYWAAAWRARGDAAAEQEAFDALEGTVGAARAREIADRHRPVNFDEEPAPPLTRADVRVEVGVLRLPPAEDVAARRTAWSSAPRVEVLPERFVLVGYGPGEPLVAVGEQIQVPLVAGPDPNAPPDEQLRPDGDTLRIPDALAWMFDFERALQVGMAFRVDLTPEQARQGVERVVVLGVRLADTPDEGRETLERLLEHHLHGRSGLELLPQGTPTNNTEQGTAGYSFRDDPDATFEVFRRRTPQYDLEADPLLRSDGQRLAEQLGLRHDFVRHVPGAGLADGSEAHAMQIALWPGTLGYVMKTLMAPVFSAEHVDQTRTFFTRYVSGRGPLPALRIGEQPYGILPTTAFDRVSWFGEGDGRAAVYPAQLYGVLRRVEADWKPLVDRVSRLGGPGDPHQVLLDVLGLHPSSVEYHPLQADSVHHKFYELALLNSGVALGLLGLFPAVLPLTLLRSFGYTGDEVPELLNRIYDARQTPLTGPVVDDVPLSESEPIRAYAGGLNYIQWLVAAAGSGIEAVQAERGFDSGRPAALLYLLLRHALQRSFHAAGVQLQVGAGVAEDARTLLREPAFVHVRDTQGSESHYAALFRPAEEVTGQSTQLLGDYIARNARTVDPALGEQLAALERLSGLPTARLERLFAEHVDTVSYRLDAWKTGLLAWALDARRGGGRGYETVTRGGQAQGGAGSGLFLGAYGWLEPLRPEGKELTPVELPADLAEELDGGDPRPLLRDPTNLGLVHAPSLNHATTAAVLRNGYVANDGRLAVNLSSRRIRLALNVLEGMRGGQSLGALLGYQFERHVHDHGALQVRELIYPLRRAFPLAANQIAKTATDDGEAKEAIAAMNVVDGRKLVEHAESGGQFAYPFGVGTLPRRAGVEDALTDALAHIRDVNDAVADLVVAEGVHQAVLGNYERSAGTLDAFAKGATPPEPEVIRTPRSGIALTLRTAVHLSATPPANPLPAIPPTPLAQAEPSVNAWLARRIPDPGDVGCRVTFTDRGTGAETTVFVDQQQLALHPIDLVYRADADADQALTDLDDRILQFLHATQAPRHDREILIRHTARVPGKVTWFELQALLRSLRALVVASRPLQPADLMRQNDAARDEHGAASIPRERVATPRDDLRDVRLPALDALVVTLDDPTVTIDDVIGAFVAAAGALAGYRLPSTGTGFCHEWLGATYTAVTEKVGARVGDWDERLARFDQLLAEHDAAPPADAGERLALLRTAEVLVSTELSPEADPGAYRASLDARRASFVAKRDQLRELVETPRATLAQLLADAQGVLPLSDFDPEPLDLAPERDEVDRFRASLRDTVGLLREEVSGRVDRADALLAEHDAASPEDRAEPLREAARAILGEDFVLVPHVTLPQAAADELENAWQRSASGALTRHLTDATPGGSGRDFPVDDWLHGVARVREKLRHWENAVLLGDALPGAEPPELVPLQLPYGPGEPWLALELPEGYEIAGDRLLYAADFAEPFDRTEPVCGLLVDEWTEVIPTVEEDTGIAFHFDRPNAEPPQAWLLALPAVVDGAWSWEELLAAVNDALDSAKLRALEPAHVQTTPYSAFLPATMSAYTFPEISISNNLLRNLQIYSALTLEGG